MLRNIDFDALRSLRDRHGAAFPRGRVLFREGDTSAEFYVVLQGSVEISIKDPQTGGKHILSVIPPGGFFGEMSCFSGMARSATAVAAEDSVLLFFNQDTAIQLMRASPRFALGVIQTLCDRIRNTNERVARLSALVGDAEKAAATAQPASNASGPSAVLAASAAVAASAARPAGSQPPRDVPPPNYDKTQLWGKVVTCPVSNARFMALNVRPEATQVKSRDSDFCEIVSGTNPLWYSVCACPDCGYAAYPDDFGTLSTEETTVLAERSDARRALMGSTGLNGERDRDAAILALRLAVDCYELRDVDPQRLGALYHRLAWLYRESGDSDNERGYLTEALKQYTGAIDAGELEPTNELTLLYTIGDLYLRLGSPVESVKWLSRASQLPEFRKQPEIARLLRERWGDARETAKARA